MWKAVGDPRFASGGCVVSVQESKSFIMVGLLVLVDSSTTQVLGRAR